MASISGFSTLCSLCRPNYNLISSSSSSSSFSFPLRVVHFQSHANPDFFCGTPAFPAALSGKNQFERRRKAVKAVAEDETLIPAQAEDDITYDNTEQVVDEGEAANTTADQPVSVPVSPSDVLTMFFQAEGTMNEMAIPTVTNALQEAEGITNLRVQVFEGIASVELTKQTTIQATGVASNLVEIIQGSGFKLQTLNLSFEDEEGII